MKAFDKWYYVKNKCDTRFDALYRVGIQTTQLERVKEAWDFQQSNIDVLLAERDVLLEVIELQRDSLLIAKSWNVVEPSIICTLAEETLTKTDKMLEGFEV